MGPALRRRLFLGQQFQPGSATAGAFATNAAGQAAAAVDAGEVVSPQPLGLRGVAAPSSAQPVATRSPPSGGAALPGPRDATVVAWQGAGAAPAPAAVPPAGLQRMPAALPALTALAAAVQRRADRQETLLPMALELAGVRAARHVTSTHEYRPAAVGAALAPASRPSPLPGVRGHPTSPHPTAPHPASAPSAPGLSARETPPIHAPAIRFGPAAAERPGALRGGAESSPGGAGTYLHPGAGPPPAAAPGGTAPDDEFLFEERLRRALDRILRTDGLRHGLNLGER